MDVLTPPTDNLYKFLAIGGIALLLVGSIAIDRDIDRVKELLRQVTVEHSVIRAKVNRTQNTLAEIRSEFAEDQRRLAGLARENGDAVRETAELSKRSKRTQPDSTEFAEIGERLSAITQTSTLRNNEIDRLNVRTQLGQQTLNGINSGNDAIEIAQAELGAKLENIDDLETELGEKSIAMATVILIGTFLAATGFRLWYKKVQKFQDQILEVEARDKLQAQADKTAAISADEEMPSI